MVDQCLRPVNVVLSIISMISVQSSRIGELRNFQRVGQDPKVMDEMWARSSSTQVEERWICRVGAGAGEIFASRMEDWGLEPLV